MEKEIFIFFHKTIACSFLDSFMLFFTQKGWILWIPVFALIVFKALRDKNYKMLFYFISCLFIGLFLADWLSLEIKNLVKRIRPCWIMDFRGIVGCTHSYSFPSNHATNALTVASILLLFVKTLFTSQRFKFALSFFISAIAIFILFSRVYLGVHWVSDILGGIILGIFLGLLVFHSITRVDSIKKFFYFSIIIVSLFRIYFILHAPIDLSPDEAHYWEWSRRLDLSYYSKGPMIAYLIAFSTWIFGDNPFGVRAFAVVCSFLSSIFIYNIAKKLFDNDNIGYLSGFLFQLIPLFSTFGVIFTIDSPFIFFWVISMYFFLLALEGKKSHWLLLGLFIGFGLLTKYTMAFFYICMFIYLLFDRKSIKNPYLYLCILISLIVFSPVIIWNFQHNWITLKHTAGQAHIYDGLKISLKYLVEFIGSQLATVTPLVFVHGFYFILASSALALTRSQKWFLIAFSLPVFLFFLLKSIHGKVQANWAMPAYIPFVIMIAYVFEKKIFKKFVFSAIIVASAFTIINYAIPYLNLPMKFDPSARLKGWKEIGSKVSEIKQNLEQQGHVIIFSNRYQISSELAFYVKDKPVVYCISLGRRMNQYDLWLPINSELKYGIVHGIYVIYGEKKAPEPQVTFAFEKCIPEPFTVYKKRDKIKNYTIFTCYNFRGISLPEPESY